MTSLEKYYELYSDDIYKFIYFLTFNKQVAEDLMQETFIKAFEAKQTFRQEAQISTWLHAIAKNHTYDYLKKKSNRYHMATLMDYTPFTGLPLSFYFGSLKSF